ncbi:hypothetical protein [Latilactobacillus curvatus]|uniref:Uncharacterized protein n=2 Tax=Latilactobacillus curvatus TaxID=28038 RepID=A0A385ADX7_LATCU|nr:hypothetical protein [Latilactobacillus curvatus]AWV72921.1 hypothetical protein C0W45_04985 [Latilactobacillus curvatus]AXN35823.1 hypothetical protein DT351_05385 [Latilactobacillus curvatus]AZP96433.1 hypothetical protein CYK59_05440 [Latilactobacillus curvatus]MCM6843660.1 hypothetical protein [Latilactobacillus curvatus]MCM6861455.1 hypothetical protein [Latilactobacillus curvatus]
MALLHFLNQNAHVIAGVAIGLIIISILFFYYGITRIGRSDERSQLIMYRVFKTMFAACLLSMILFMTFVPDRLTAVRDWFTTLFSLVFISGACAVFIEPRRKV